MFSAGHFSKSSLTQLETPLHLNKKKYKIGHFCEPQIWMFSNLDQWQAGTRIHETKPSSPESLWWIMMWTLSPTYRKQKVSFDIWPGKWRIEAIAIQFWLTWDILIIEEKKKVFCGFNYLKNCFKLPGNPVDSEVIEVTSPQHVICMATHKSKNNESMKDWIGKKLGKHSPTKSYQLPGLPWARSHQLTEWPYHRTGGLAAWIKTKCDAQKHRKISSWLF